MMISALLAVENTSIFDTVSPPANSIRSLSFLIFAITGAIFVLVEIILIYALVRFRRKPSDGTNEPPQVYGSTPIEIAWTAAPALVVFVLGLVVTRTLADVKLDPDNPPKDSRPLRVTVIGKQWWWEYAYESYDGEDLHFITANELHVPSSNDKIPSERHPIFLTLESADVSHSFWVPRLAGKTDLIPRRTNHMWFETGSKGLYVGQCAEFCGTQHAKMLLRVKVESPEEFHDWLEKQKATPKLPAEGSEAAKGRKVFLKTSCVNCHRIHGTSEVGTYAPDLTHLMSRETFGAGILPRDKENLKKWIEDPQAFKPGCLMPGFKNLKKEDLDSMVEYLDSLK